MLTLSRPQDHKQTRRVHEIFCKRMRPSASLAVDGWNSNPLFSDIFTSMIWNWILNPYSFHYNILHLSWRPYSLFAQTVDKYPKCQIKTFKYFMLSIAFVHTCVHCSQKPGSNNNPTEKATHNGKKYGALHYSLHAQRAGCHTQRSASSWYTAVVCLPYATILICINIHYLFIWVLFHLIVQRLSFPSFISAVHLLFSFRNRFYY